MKKINKIIKEIENKMAELDPAEMLHEDIFDWKIILQHQIDYLKTLIEAKNKNIII